jgi:transposase InsO family protein
VTAPTVADVAEEEIREERRRWAATLSDVERRFILGYFMASNPVDFERVRAHIEAARADVRAVHSL